MIELREIHKSYQVKGSAIPALTGVDLNVRAGEIFGIIAQLHTVGTATSLTFPAGVLTAGNSYFAVIRPTYEPGRDIINKPLIRGGQEFFFETVTNSFTP